MVMIFSLSVSRIREAVEKLFKIMTRFFIVTGQKTQIKVNSSITDPTSGGVTLQHDVQKSSADGTKVLLNYFKENHLEVVRLDEVEEFKVTKKCVMK